jgi:hypothetical protein
MSLLDAPNAPHARLDYNQATIVSTKSAGPYGDSGHYQKIVRCPLLDIP